MQVLYQLMANGHNAAKWLKGARDMHLLFLEYASVHSNVGIISKSCGSKFVDTSLSKGTHPVKCKVYSSTSKKGVSATKDCVVTGFDTYACGAYRMA